MDKSPDKIKNMFDEIAQKYDFNNNLISFGTHKFIKKLCINSIDITPDTKALDLCTGTGDIANLLKQKTENVIGVDFSEKMLSIARKKYPKIKFIEADCTDLPFDDNSFDLITISFGLRNIQNYEKAIKEIKRVLKNNGLLLYIDFGKTLFLSDKIYDSIILFLTKTFLKKSIAYEYLIKSKQTFFNSENLIAIFDKYDFKLKKSFNFALGVISAKHFINYKH